jgi:hypothetical protein
MSSRRRIRYAEERISGLGTRLLSWMGATATPTSVTDRTEYVDFCARAAADQSVFASFRQEPVYIAMLEHVTVDQGADYLRIIERDNPSLLNERLEVFRANDRLGSPTTYEYPRIGHISPVTLRYLKVVSDIQRLFGDLHGKRIVEVGVGYGGQARLLMEQWSVQSYTLIDLMQVLQLARRYIGALGTYPSAKFVPPAKVRATDYDLFISNYAFSELRRGIQLTYAKSLIATSRRGYLTCNFISEAHGLDSLSRAELLGLHPGAHWMEEEPLTFEGNAILIWGDEIESGTSTA